MRFVCERDVLIKEISVAQDIISSKTQLSIFSNVYIAAADQRLVIRASDQKVSFNTTIPVEVLTPGTTTVYCDKLLGALRSMPEGLILLSLDDSLMLTVQPSGGSTKVKYQLRCIPAEKFPEFSSISDDLFFELPQDEFLSMISQTIFAVSDDESRYFMNGVFFERVDDKLVMVATDGRRLSFISKTLTVDIPSFPGLIIPPKVLALLRKLLPGEGPMSIAIGDKTVFFHFGNQFLSSALIDGQFPNYQRVIPEKQAHRFSVPRMDLAEALKRVSLLVDKKSHRIVMNVSQNTICLSSEEKEIGTASEDIPCSYDGDEIKLAFNYMYIADPIRSMSSETVAIEFTETNKAITIKPDPESDFFHIVMPMQMD